MGITIEQVEQIAQLAKLRFSDAEKEKMAEELTEILRYMEKLNELDTRNVEPLSHPLELANVLRPDRAEPSLAVEEALQNAPSRQGGFFKVPKVIK